MKQLWTPWRMAYLTQQTKPEGCVFCNKLLANDDQEHVLARGNHCYVTLNLYPYNNGHLMIVPNAHVARLDELDDKSLSELIALTRDSISVLEAAYKPQGFNIGINLGSAAGAGIAEHLHQHVVPRWSGDTNFLSVVGETRTIPEMVGESYTKLKKLWDEINSSG
jgi:ATP adenylyltransferase